MEWDAVELPSQFLENFCWEWEVLQSMTAHVDTGASLPRSLYEKVLSAKNFQSGMQMVRQLEFALFDMQLHHHFDRAKATRSEDLAKDIPLARDGDSTTHFSVIDQDGMAVANTYTLERSYGSRVVVTGAGFLLNNEMLDFNWRPGVTDKHGTRRIYAPIMTTSRGVFRWGYGKSSTPTATPPSTSGSPMVSTMSTRAR